MTDDTTQIGPAGSEKTERIPAERTEPTPAEKAERLPAEQRGHLVLASKVIERIAQAAAGEVAGVVQEPAARGRRRATPTVQANARLDGQFARVHLNLAARYPEPIPDVVAQVRRRVADRVRELAEVTVTSCDVDVTSLRPPYLERRIR